jgi:proteasome alpha subunit
MPEIRTAIPEEVDVYLDAIVQKGVFSNKAELVRAALVSYVNETGTFFGGFDAETVFAPDGRLYQVEYARESAKRGGTAVGIVCDDGVLLAAETVGSSKLSAGAKKIQSVSDRLALVASGLVGDAALVIDELHAATPTPKTTDEVIRTMRGTLHRFTLSRTQRPLGVAYLVATVLDRKPRLAYLDPSGATADYLATAMGRGATAAQEILESRYKKMRLADAERLIPDLFGRDTPTEVARVSG